MIWIAQAVDPNYGLTERADSFAMATVALDTAARRFYLLDMLHGRFEPCEHRRIVTEHYQKWAGPNYYRCGVQTIFLETQLYRDLLRDGVVRLKEIPRRAGKGLGAHTKLTLLTNLQYRYQAGQIVHPGSGGKEERGGRPDETAAWLPGYEEELLKINFDERGTPRHAHDDRVEAVALAVEVLAVFLHQGSGEPEHRVIPVQIGA